MKSKRGNTVIKSNVLLESKYKITTLEMKVFLSVIAQIKREDICLKNYRIYVQDFLTIEDKKQGGLYGRLKSSCKKLVSSVLEIREDIAQDTEGPLIVSFFSSARMYKNYGYIDIRIDERLAPYLIQLKKNFTVFDIRNVMRCKSVYSIRIYQLLKQYEKLKKRTFEIGELKDILGLKPDQYAQWINFKTKVIEPARQELQRYSDIYFVYRGNRKGRAFNSLTFTIKRKKLKRSTDTGPAVDSYEEALEKLNAPNAPLYAP